MDPRIRIHTKMSWIRNTAPFPCHTIPGSYRYRASDLVGAAETGVIVQGGFLGDDLPAVLTLGQQPEVGAQGSQIRDPRITRSEKEPGKEARKSVGTGALRILISGKFTTQDRQKERSWKRMITYSIKITCSLTGLRIRVRSGFVQILRSRVQQKQA